MPLSVTTESNDGDTVVVGIGEGEGSNMGDEPGVEESSNVVKPNESTQSYPDEDGWQQFTCTGSGRLVQPNSQYMAWQ